MQMHTCRLYEANLGNYLRESPLSSYFSLSYSQRLCREGKKGVEVLHTVYQYNHQSGTLWKPLSNGTSSPVAIKVSMSAYIKQFQLDSQVRTGEASSSQRLLAQVPTSQLPVRRHETCQVSRCTQCTCTITSQVFSRGPSAVAAPGQSQSR